MLLRDPIHGLVCFEGEAEKLIRALLDTREVQRLRRVRQLGLAALVFPGAEHSRFSHALGTAHVMQRWLSRLRAVQCEVPVEERLDPEAEREALAAALLHDLGHGPFSHLFEDVLPGVRRHERWTEALIRDSSTDVHVALEGFGEGTAERVAALMAGRHRVPYLPATISGTLDADRCDYLLRDSHMTGVRYGLYDLDWLLQAITLGRIEDEQGRPCTVLAVEGRKGLPPIESFFHARSSMYQQVYHHKAVRAAEVLVRMLFVRLRQLVACGRAPRDVPPGLGGALAGHGVSIGDFLDLDDAVMMAAFSSWQRGEDQTLADLSRRFLQRELPKTLPLPEDESAEPIWGQCREMAYEVAREH